ncbi:hypothetical protein PLICRDRAFT_524484 [Plicaturopsis crispa FD-325 SS-3]|nr:hypothetical protein PLICRDRAFT_524484 [Plicaturopsis crispa FD-325 SS-3]
MPASPAANLHGPALIGIFFNCILYGACLMQTVRYFETYTKDPTWIKVYVGVLMVADTLNSIFSIYWIYNVLVDNFMNIEALLTLPWPLAADPALVGIVAFMVQAFFAWRVRVITQNSYIAGAIFCCSLVTLVGGVTFAVFFQFLGDVQTLATKPIARTLAIVWLVPAAVADVSITTALSWHLRRRRTGFSATDSAITRIVRLTVQNGALTTIIALLDLIAFLSLKNSGLHVGFSFPLPKLYTNSVLSSLNARDPTRHTGYSGDSSGPATTGVRAHHSTPHELFVSVEMQKTVHGDSGDADNDWSDSHSNTKARPV